MKEHSDSKSTYTEDHQDARVSDRKKEEICFSPMTKTPSPTENTKKKKRDNIKKRQQKLRLHNDCGPT